MRVCEVVPTHRLDVPTFCLSVNLTEHWSGHRSIHRAGRRSSPCLGACKLDFRRKPGTMSAPFGDKRLTTDVHYDEHHDFSPDHSYFGAYSGLESKTDSPHLQTPQSSKEHSGQAKMPQNLNFEDKPLP